MRPSAEQTQKLVKQPANRATANTVSGSGKKLYKPMKKEIAESTIATIIEAMIILMFMINSFRKRRFSFFIINVYFIFNLLHGGGDKRLSNGK